MVTAPPSPLAYLGFQLIPPRPALHPYVRFFWSMRRATPLPAYHEERMYPRGGYGLVFNFGDTVCLDQQPVSEPLFLDGTTTFSRTIGVAGTVELLGVQFQEGGAYPVLGVPLAELRNETAILEILDRPTLLRLHTQLYEAPSLAARIQLLDAWLGQRLLLGNRCNMLIPASLKLLRERAGQLPIAQLAAACAISQRQLERYYQCQVGMSPKQYSQLLRVEAARLALKHTHAPSTSYLAAELGFYDQAHFIREFCAVMGMTPTAYKNRPRAYVGPMLPLLEP